MVTLQFEKHLHWILVKDRVFVSIYIAENTDIDYDNDNTCLLSIYHGRFTLQRALYDDLISFKK